MSNEVLKRLEKQRNDLKSKRSNWNNQWQIVGKYISQVKQNFEEKHAAGDFLNDEVYDSTGTFAAKNSASALVGIIFPSVASKSVAIDPPKDMDDITEEERYWYEEIVTKRLTAAMDDPRSNLALSVDEYMLDQAIFGTSGIGVFWNSDKLLYRPFGVSEMMIDEGKDGNIDTVFIDYQWTVERVVEKYGIDNVSSGLAEKYRSGATGDLIDVVCCITPRNKDSKKPTNLDMPFMSVHYEPSTKHVLKESGFEEFPVLVTRFRKLMNEKYGRSMGMDAIPDIREINALREAVIVATEKIIDPPLGLMGQDMLGGNVVDTSSGALNVFDSQSNMGNNPPIFPINTVGDISTALARIEELKSSIAQHFNIDRLLDFNNQTQMTATETVQRSNIRNNSLSSMINRQTSTFTKLVERSVNLMMRNDSFGYIEGTPEFIAATAFGEDVDVIPDRIAQRMLNGDDVYHVRFTTPADRILSAEELEGMYQLVQLNQQLMQTHPDAQSYLDISEVHKNALRLTGAPSDIVKSDEAVIEEQEQQAQQMQQQQQLDQAQQLASIVSNANQGES